VYRIVETGGGLSSGWQHGKRVPLLSELAGVRMMTWGA